MKATRQLSPDSGSLYFDLQADFGITKHMGGTQATRELAEMCHIGPHSHVLDVGCGIGTTSCFLAQEYACRVAGVDISEAMVARATERARRRGVEAQVECKVADAQELPFEDSQFDAVLDESVLAFVPDKAKAVAEYVRVARPGGYVGLNEVCWVKPPPEDLARYIGLVMAGADFLSHEGWGTVLGASGLQEMQVRSHKFQVGRQWRGEMEQMDFRQSVRAWYRFVTGIFTQPAYRSFAREVLRVPGNIFQFMAYIGYGLYAGRKSD